MLCALVSVLDPLKDASRTLLRLFSLLHITSAHPPLALPHQHTNYGYFSHLKMFLDLTSFTSHPTSLLPLPQNSSKELPTLYPIPLLPSFLGPIHRLSPHRSTKTILVKVTNTL